MRPFIIFILGILSIRTAICQELNEIYSYERNIYNPTSFYVLNEDTILTVELDNKKAVLSLHDIKNQKIIASRRAGRGPGELSQNGKKYISDMGTDSIWVWDEGQRKGIIYDQDLNYLGDIVAKDKAINSALILNDTTVVTKKMFDRMNVAELRRLNGNRIEEVYAKIHIRDFSPLKQIAINPLLNQGPLITDNQNAYLGFDFGSTILSIFLDGEVDTLATPHSVPFPVVEHDEGYSAPDQAKSPLASLSISSNGKNIFVLFSGKKFDDGPFKQLKAAITGKLAEEIEKSDNTKEILVIDKKSKKYIGSLNLPVMSKRIFVHGNSLYTLSYRNKRYSIIKYKLNN